MKNNYIYDIIGRYLANEASEGDKAIFNNWLNESEKNTLEFELHKKAWEETHVHFVSKESEFLFKNILNKIDDQHELEIDRSPKIKTKNLNQRLVFISKIAASLLLFASIWYYVDNAVFENTSQARDIQTIRKHNIAGQKSKIFLPDGSEVWLNAESRISYPEKFSEDKRAVELEGEAFFDVIKNPDQPFVVKTGQVSTTVLGTSFGVKAFGDEPAIYVALRSGKVKVENEEINQEVFLEPGEAIKYQKSQAVLLKEEFDREVLFAWKDGVIVFKDAGLDEIVNTLSRWYGVQFEVQNSKNEAWSYTGSFDNAILENVLKSISFTKEFSYQINQKNVTLKLN